MLSRTSRRTIARPFRRNCVRGPWTFNARENYYSWWRDETQGIIRARSSTVRSCTDRPRPQLRLHAAFRVTVGANNIFNNRPDKIANTADNPIYVLTGSTSDGQVYPRLGGPFGINGGFWYVRRSGSFRAVRIGRRRWRRWWPCRRRRPPRKPAPTEAWSRLERRVRSLARAAAAASAAASAERREASAANGRRSNRLDALGRAARFRGGQFWRPPHFRLAGGHRPPLISRRIMMIGKRLNLMLTRRAGAGVPATAMPRRRRRSGRAWHGRQRPPARLQGRGRCPEERRQCGRCGGRGRLCARGHLPEAGNLGGGGFMTVRFHDGRTTFIDFRETAPRRGDRDHVPRRERQSGPGRSRRGYLAVGVPGTVAGLELARDEVRHAAARGADGRRRSGWRATASCSTRAMPTCSPTPPTNSARTRRAPRSSSTTASRGSRASGWSRPTSRARCRRSRRAGRRHSTRARSRAKIVAASKAGGGILATRDFADYQARELKPLECDYRGYHMISAPPPSSGGVVLCETFNILEGYPIGELGFHSAAGTHLLTEAMRRAYARPQRQPRRPELRHDPTPRTSSTRAMPRSFARGSIPTARRRRRASAARRRRARARTPPTSRSSTRTAMRSSLTYTLNDWFGAHVTAAGTGILLNDEMDDFSAKPGVAQHVRPGRRAEQRDRAGQAAAVAR